MTGIAHILNHKSTMKPLRSNSNAKLFKTNKFRSSLLSTS